MIASTPTTNYQKPNKIMNKSTTFNSCDNSTNSDEYDKKDEKIVNQKHSAIYTNSLCTKMATIGVAFLDWFFYRRTKILQLQLLLSISTEMQ